MSSYETSRLAFTPDAADPDKWWAIDENNVEYCIHPAWDSDLWTCFAQRRVAFDSTTQALGNFAEFEEAAEACDAFDPVEAGLLGGSRFVQF